MTGKLLRLSINRALVDKNAGGDVRLFADGFENVEINIVNLADEIKQGHAFAPELSGRRKAENFVATDVVAVDIDYGMTLDQALANPLIIDHAGIIYTTVSHTPEAPRLRVVFQLAHTITDVQQQRAIARALALRLGGDVSATDPARLFYGNRRAVLHAFPGRVMSAELQEELIKQGANVPTSDVGQAGGRIAGARSLLPMSPSRLVRRATGGYPVPVSDLPEKTPVYCPNHADQNASGFIVVSKRGVKGIHCSSCMSTFWAGPADGFDFDSFERIVRAAHKYASQTLCKNVEKPHECGPLGELFGFPENEFRMLGSTATVVRGAAAPTQLQTGVTLVKSAKGTGKTLALRRLIRPMRSVLLIGHRRSLIGATCERLDLRCYLDAPPGSYIDIPGRRIGICLDSLRRIEPVHAAPEVVILDEAVQVLGHFLSDTLEKKEGGNRQRIFKIFSGLIAGAKYVVALDADIDIATYRTLARMRREAGAIGRRRRRRRRHQSASSRRPRKTVSAPWYDKRIHVWLNEDKPGEGKHVQLFESKNHLLGELKRLLTAGAKVYVAANAKAFLEKLEAAISQEMPHVRLLTITADTRPRDAQRAFLINPAAEAVRYDLILASPAIGTGIDISFPGGKQEIDAVLGFFEPLVLNHLDIDQMIGRVRNPGAVMIWISPRLFGFETNVESVKRDILEQALYKDLLIDYQGEGGTARYKRDDRFIEMAAQFVARDRASKNDLRGCFIEHKLSQGYVIEHVAAQNELGSTGGELTAEGTRINREIYHAGLISAQALPPSEFQRVVEAIESGRLVNEGEQLAVARNRLELFYRQPVSSDLIDLDDRGRYRDRVRRHSRVLQYNASERHNDSDPPFEARDKFIRDSHIADAAVARALQVTPLLRPSGFDSDFTFDARDLVNFAAFARAHKSVLENQLGIEIRRDLAQKPVLQLKQFLRLVGLDIVKVGSVKDGGNKVYRYRLDSERLDRLNQLLRRREQTSAWRFVAALHGWGESSIDDDDDSDADA